MEVHIQNIVSHIRAVDSDSLLTPQILQRIVSAVLQAVEEREDHRMRVSSEMRHSGGARDELEEWE